VNPVEAAAEVRRTTSALREANAIRRKLDRLAATGAELPPSSKRLLEEAVIALERLAHDLARHQRTEQRRLADTLRRGHS
jgi:hypothetical protein